MTRMRSGLLGFCAAGIVSVSLVWASSRLHRQKLAPPRIAIQPSEILADGYDAALLTIESGSAEAPRISFSDDAQHAVIESIAGGNGRWQARIRAGVTPGRVRVQVNFPERPPAIAELSLRLDSNDSAEDGTPDFLRLEAEGDRRAFRRWFTYLAEAQYFQAPAARPSEIVDCAALIRYAYREALHAHDSGWADSAQLSVIPAFDSVEKYQYPFTPLGSALYRTKPGPFEAADLSNGTFLQFADARSLWRFNTHFISRDLARAAPGDLLFFRQQTDRVTFHSMIYLGASQLRKDGRRYVLYHTGPEGANPGEIRRLTVEELSDFPQAQWRPLASNPSFLGVARWNILRDSGEGPRAQ